MDDIDEDAVQRALGRAALDDMAALQRIERELHDQGYLIRGANGTLELSPRAVRRLGATALRKVFSDISAKGRGAHDVRDAGAAGDVTGASRAWVFGDEQSLDVVRTVRNAVLRAGPGPVRLQVDDFEVVETERRTSAAVALLVDLSFSMELRGTWAAAKQTALALHSLVTTQFPQDAIEIIGFSDYAQVLQAEQLAGLDPQRVQGNLQHALMLAGRFLGKHPGDEQVVLVVTDGEPTAHLTRDGWADFCWPPMAETLELTMAEVERITRRGATINVFMLDDEPRLVAFVEQLARRNGGRLFAADPDKLGSTSSATTCGPAEAAARADELLQHPSGQAGPTVHLEHRNRAGPHPAVGAVVRIGAVVELPREPLHPRVVAHKDERLDLGRSLADDLQQLGRGSLVDPVVVHRLHVADRGVLPGLARTRGGRHHHPVGRAPCCVSHSRAAAESARPRAESSREWSSARWASDFECLMRTRLGMHPGSHVLPCVDEVARPPHALGMTMPFPAPGHFVPDSRGEARRPHLGSHGARLPGPEHLEGRGRVSSVHQHRTIIAQNVPDRGAARGQ